MNVSTNNTYREIITSLGNFIDIRKYNKNPKKIKSHKKDNSKVERKYTKPLDKKENKYRDSRKSNNNSFKTKESPSHKICACDCYK